MALQNHKHYDYIITGAGCAGLSLLMRLLHSKRLQHKNILLIDQDAKKSNDRTWCFWEKGEGFFERVVAHSWPHLWFHADGFSKKMDIRPYRYKVIRGAGFYTYCFEKIQQHANVHFLQTQVESIDAMHDGAEVKTKNGVYKGSKVFNSILFQKPMLRKNEYWLLQHFKGWMIETTNTFFDESTGTLMDFRTGQEQGATFFYVLPFAPNKALIEYTVFSEKVLGDEDYERALHEYVENRLGLQQYTILEKEFGVIPMTNHAFSAGDARVVNIGTAGGATKGSSGYTFQFIQKQTAHIVQQLESGSTTFSKPHSARRFQFYDSVLLHILKHRTLSGASIFKELFRKNKPQQVLQFLDNESTLPQELKLISTLPTLPFSKAAAKHLFY